MVVRIPREKETDQSEKPRLNRKLYELLQRCSDKKDMSEWNTWSEANPETPVLLERAFLVEAYLKGACLLRFNLQRAILQEANLQGTILLGVNLQEAVLVKANLQGADLRGANLQRADFRDANLQGADLRGANLQRANFRGANLQEANLAYANLEGMDFLGANLQGANFTFSIVDSETLIRNCTFDEKTDFTGVGLGGARIDPDLREALEGNTRRFRWLRWYRERPRRRWPILLFWWTSDYGRSTFRIVETFLIAASIFTVIYCAYGLWDGCDPENPGIVQNLFKVGEESVKGWMVPLRAFYFSVVTMTTLGFGDMYAKPSSLAGHLIVILHVITGYVLLGALITRLGVLFTGGGPGATRSKPSAKK